MNDRVEIRIKNYDKSYWLYLAILTTVFWIWLGVILYSHSTISIVMFVLYITAYGFYIYLNEKKTEVIADVNSVCWKKYAKQNEIRCEDIIGLTCEPYEKRGRGVSYQCLRLTIELKNSVRYIEFNDEVKASDLLDEKINGTKSDIELLKLYEFLKEHCRENLEKNSEIDIEI